MNALWIAVAIAIFAVLAKWIPWRFEHAGASGLGFVSHQWLEEHRRP